ncbi:unnamed protein product [Caenorhabditis angaria]|uniref:Uncharacterized protein n=1 Tax=Caenorhabditis angaria TaxID=860376 RepID=A0A9P1IR06_9PELO|nr:unnamed protein product [Caenorhabditis angaria]
MSTSTAIFTFFLVISLVSANIRYRRNSYGDELVTPSGGGAPPPPQYISEVAAATVAPQGGGAQTGIMSSGYRAKRDAQNGYGDESVTPSAGESSHPVMAVESSAVHVDQAGGSSSSVHSSGY